MYFRDRIRDERKFKSVDELVRQIRKDVEYARDAKLTVRRNPPGPRRREAGGR